MNQSESIHKLTMGKILIAQPFMQDDFFKRSVIFITDHHEDGTVGFMLNRPLRMNVKNLVTDFPRFSASVFTGGPVQKDTIHYIHTAGKVLDGSREVLPGVFWGGDFNKLKFLVSNGVIGPHDIRFFVGYSGWSPGQLESELDEKTSWILANGDPNYVFYNETIDIWKQILSHRGENYSLLASINDEIHFN